MNKNKIGALTLLVACLPGCILAPGMKQTVPPTTKGVEIIQITPDLIRSRNIGVDVKEQGVKSPRDLKVALRSKIPGYEDRYKYRIGPRDILTITVWDHPELTIPAGQFRSPEAAGRLVGEDGTIFYPFVGKVKVSGKTSGEVRDLLTERLSRRIVNPQLDVRVAAFRSQKAYVVGQVAKPGPQAITDVPLTIVDAVDIAGDVTADADKINVILNRDGKTLPVNLLSMFEGGNLSKNYVLEDGDILYVPNLSYQTVFVMGEVARPETVTINNGRITLTEALGRVGGVSQITSNPELIYVIRGGSEPDDWIIYHLNAQSADALILGEAFQLKPRDVVFVGTAGVTRWNRVISQLLPSLSFVRATSTSIY